MLLAIRNLTFYYDHRLLFDNFSFSASAGDLVSLTGPNGSGKTSFIKLLTGLAVPQQGGIFWRGDNITKIKDHYQRQINYIGHKNALHESMSALENLVLFYGLTEAQALENLKLYQLEKFSTRQIKYLSAGQQRKIALCRLDLTKQLWILDEPFSSLDQTGIVITKERIKAYLKNNGLVFLSAHNMQLADLQTKEINLEPV